MGWSRFGKVVGILAGCVAVIGGIAAAAWGIVTYNTRSHIETLDARIRVLEAENQKLRGDNEQKQKIASPSSPVGQLKPKQPSLDIHFIAPVEDERIERDNRKVDLEFSTTGTIPKGFYRAVMVKDPRGKYWYQGPAETGTFPNVPVGIEGDKGKFEVGVCITDQRLVGGKEYHDLPHNLLYRKVTVIRE